MIIINVPQVKKVEVKSFSHVRLFATPWTVAYHASLSMGFSRQEYCSGLPFPSPEDLPNWGNESGSPALQVDSLPAESPGKSRNTGVGSLSLLQGISLTQESNQGLLHCRQTLYQLSYPGSSLSEIIFLLCKRKTKLYITAFCRDWVSKAVD